MLDRYCLLLRLVRFSLSVVGFVDSLAGARVGGCRGHVVPLWPCRFRRLHRLEWIWWVDLRCLGGG